MEVFDNEIVPSCLQNSIGPILRVATEIQSERPRCAYLCRFYALEKTHRLVPTSSECGVRQFKTNLHQRLERDNATSLEARTKKTDAREIETFYKQYYEHYVVELGKGDKADRSMLAKAYQTAGVLFEVLCAVNKTEKVEEVAPEIMATTNDIQTKNEIYTPYNILPLDGTGSNQSIMQLEEEKAVVPTSRYTRGSSIEYNALREEMEQMKVERKAERAAMAQLEAQMEGRNAEHDWEIAEIRRQMEMYFAGLNHNSSAGLHSSSPSLLTLICDFVFNK